MTMRRRSWKVTSWTLAWEDQTLIRTCVQRTYDPQRRITQYKIRGPCGARSRGCHVTRDGHGDLRDEATDPRDTLRTHPRTVSRRRSRVGKRADGQRSSNAVRISVPPWEVHPRHLGPVQPPQATLQMESDSTRARPRRDLWENTG